MADDAAEHSLLEVCAIQWRACVQSALDALDTLPSERVLSLRYETLVRDPDSVDRLARFTGIPDTAPTRKFYDQEVRDTFVGRGRTRLSAAEREALTPLLHAPLERLGYPAATSTRSV